MNKDLILGCLLGGAVGDALGAPAEFMSLSKIRYQLGDAGVREYLPAYGGIGRITDDTQMTLFTLEGMMRARMRYDDRGICSIPDVLHNAYLRWMVTQGLLNESDIDPVSQPGWLIRQEVLHHSRAPGNSCISSLLNPQVLGTMTDPINNSKGCGGVMRAAPVGLFEIYSVFETGCEIAALTHGHPSGYLSAGFLAELIHHLIHGKPILEAIDLTTDQLLKWPGHEEVLQAIIKALNLVKHAEGTPEEVEQLGAGWVAEEALAISIFCALMADDMREGVLLAVNHSGDSDSTGAITGNVLGAIHGREGIPDDLLEDLEVKDIIVEMVDDLFVMIGTDEVEQHLPDETGTGVLASMGGISGVPEVIKVKYPPN